MAKVAPAQIHFPVGNDTVAGSTSVDAVVKARVVLLRLMFAALISHFRSSSPPFVEGYVKEETMLLLEKLTCKKSIELSIKDTNLREAIGLEPKIWHDLVDVFHTASQSLQARSFSNANDQSAENPDPPSSNIIVTHSSTLLKDLQRLDNVLTLSRNVVTVGERVQNLSASVGFDKEVCAMINLCIKVTARGYDGDGTAADEDKWQGVINGFKKLLITSLQFISNLITLNEKLKLMLWVEFFDSATDPVSSSLSYRHLAPPESSPDSGKSEKPTTASGSLGTVQKDGPSTLELRIKKPTCNVPGQPAWPEPRLETRIFDGLPDVDDERRVSDATSSASEAPLPPNPASAQSLASSNVQRMDTAADGAKKLQDGKEQLLKRLENANGSSQRDRSSLSPIQSPTSLSESKNQEDPNMDDDDDEDDSGEEVSSDDEDIYAMPGEDGRGLLTDVPLILGPNEIEILPMIIMSGIVAPADSNGTNIKSSEKSEDPRATINMYTIRCHLLLAQENGRNLLRELLIFVAAWDLREEELYFKFMVKILEAILMNGLMPFAYSAFKESKDIISPAQAVIMKLLTKIFQAKQGFTGPRIPQLQTPFPDPLNPSSAEKSLDQPPTYDTQIVQCLFSEFRQQIIPQICALIFLQGQIRQGYAHLDDFPLNLWDMERMYEGVYQYLEFFAILTDHDEWKQLMADWEVTSELVTLLRELDIAIPKGTLQPLSSPRPSEDPAKDLPAQSSTSSKQTPEPVSVERPYDITTSPHDTPAPPESIPPFTTTSLAAEGTVTTSPYPEPIHDEPADFEWRNLKKLCVLVLSSLVWKNKRLQDQVRNFGGITTLLACCHQDMHNPYIREHAIMCLRFLLEGNDANMELIRAVAKGNGPSNDPMMYHLKMRQAVPSNDTSASSDQIAIPREVIDHQDYETFVDAKGQVGLKRKEKRRSPGGGGQEGGSGSAQGQSQTQAQAQAAKKAAMLDPGRNLPEWIQKVINAKYKGDTAS